MKKRNIFIMILSFIVLVMSCGLGTKKSEQEGNYTEKMLFETEVKNDDKAVEDTTLKVAMVLDSPFKGIFSEALSEDRYDSNIKGMFMNSNIFEVDENFEIIDTGIANIEVDVPNKKATIKIRENIKWSDGEPLTIDDVIYSYEVIGHKDYTGVRYNENSKKIIGMEDYKKGIASTISGIKKIDNRTMEISFTQLGHEIYTVGNGLIGYAMPKHHLKDVPIASLISSDKIRKDIVSLGAYIPTKIVQGESIEFKVNPHYYKGEAKIKKATIQIVNPQTIVAALKSGLYDIVLSMPGDLYNTYKDLDNINILGVQELYYSYMGFKVGKFDKTKGENITNPNAKMNNKNLRQALAYGINVDEMAKAFYHGLRERATSQVPPIFSKYHPKDMVGYPYNPEKSKQLLDEAGYKDINGDGYREDKDGKPFEIKVAFISGGDIAEPLSQFYIQQWKEIGIKAVLTTGRLIEFNLFYDKVQADDPEIDVFFGAWGVGTNLNPIESGGRASRFNYTRFTSEENDRLMLAISDPKSLTEEGYKAKAYKEWLEYYTDQAVEVPLTYRYEIVPVNKRVKNFSIGYDNAKNGMGIHLLELTAKDPIKATK